MVSWFEGMLSIGMGFCRALRARILLGKRWIGFRMRKGGMPMSVELTGVPSRCTTRLNERGWWDVRFGFSECGSLSFGIDSVNFGWFLIKKWKQR